MNVTAKPYQIVIGQLRVGMFVILDLSWLQHDFPRNSFKIKNEEQLAKIRALGLKRIRIDPMRSDTVPEPLAPGESATPDTDATAGLVESPMAKAKRERVERINQLRAAVVECESQFVRTANTLKQINNNLFARPQEAYQRANELVDHLVDSVLTDRDIAIHLMKDKIGGEEMYFHSLNVSVLAMMLAKQLKLPKEQVKELGFGSLFHDIGKLDIPARVLHKTTPLTRAEQNLVEMHCAYGEPIAKKLGLSKPAIDIIMEHHEYMDGSGYPARLKGDRISPLARIVAVVNTYDNLCNRPNIADSVSPYAALAHMFARQRNQLDSEPLGIFIRCLGVYPPGTVVRLSDGTPGLVVAVNSAKPLRPSVLIYDPGVPSSEAIILDLEHEPDINIAECLKPMQLSREAHAYLNPRKRMSYYFDLPNSRPKARG
ncbi:MAG TPA: HD-GYP domain-containing protein [Noviherbaspirillum sp.]|uniref:HD-GYP domain-containing protein n=1 Tax=Noviherbaspirillum sp. TaxID=1926288 RepID=UPI002B4667BA|nr:HD-GYP domain-containing protein [Noviherbaspirillum sp.]HJV87635.1 HD-GYP domain-containing protein [Noviherbaspirillum sp.]